MRFHLQKTPKRTLSQVVVGCAHDVRWRGVESDTIDATRRHEAQQTTLRQAARQKVTDAARQRISP